MVAVFVLLCILLANSGVESSVFKGKGDACFASYFLNKTGITFIYRPQDYEIYSPLGRSWKALVMWSSWKSKRYAKHYYPEKVINSNYTVRMLWSDEGKYFYQQQTTGTLEPHDWIGYAVYITDIISERIYEDTYGFYKISPDFGFCEIDNRESNQTLCSQALTTAKFYQKTLMNKPAVTPYKGKGKVYITGTGWLNPGVRFIYQPENYQKYSPEGQGWIAYVSYEWRTSYDKAVANYSWVLANRETWRILKWNTKGKYYSYDQYDERFVSSTYGYGVDIVNIDGQTIYEDTYNFYNASSSGIHDMCELDSISSTGHQCSTALASLEKTGHPHITYRSNSDDYFSHIHPHISSWDKGKLYASLQAGFAMLVILVILVRCCARKPQCQPARRVSLSNPRNGRNRRNVSATNPTFFHHEQHARSEASTSHGIENPPASNATNGEHTTANNPTAFHLGEESKANVGRVSIAFSAHIGDAANGESTSATNPMFLHNEEQAISRESTNEDETVCPDMNPPIPSIPPPPYDYDENRFVM